MEDYNVVTLFKADTFTVARQSGQSAAIETLKRRVRKMHARHVFATLLRATLSAGLIVLGADMVESSWGNALAVTAGFFLAHTLLFSIRGHWNISRFRQARMYWLQDELVDQDVSPVFLRTNKPESMQKAG